MGGRYKGNTGTSWQSTHPESTSSGLRDPALINKVKIDGHHE